MRISTNTVIQKDNIQQLDGIIRLVKELAVDNHLFAVVIKDFAAELSEEVGNYTFTLKRKKELSFFAKKLNVKLIWAKHNDCFEPWLRPCITWQGYLIPCYVRPVAEEFNLGNIFETPFEQLWNNETIQNFRNHRLLHLYAKAVQETGVDTIRFTLRHIYPKYFCLTSALFLYIHV